MDHTPGVFTKEKATVAKGVAVTLMVFHHLFRIPDLYKNIEIRFYPFSEAFVNELFAYFKLCVGMFAFISGYGLCKSWKNEIQTSEIKKVDASYSAFVKRRYVRTMSGYWFVFVVSLVLCELLDHRTGRAYFSKVSKVTGLMNVLTSFLGFSSILGTVQLSDEWWYISANVAYIILTPFIYSFLKKWGKYASVACLVIVPRILGVSFLGGTAPFSFIMPFLVGMIFEEYDGFMKIHYAMQGLKKECWRVLGFVFAFVAVYKLYTRLPFGSYWEIKYTLPPLVMILFINEYGMRVNVLAKLFSFIGKHSLNIWLVHYTVRRYLMKHIYGMPHFILSCIVLLVLSLIVSILIEQLKKVLRYEKCIKRISDYLMKWI